MKVSSIKIVLLPLVASVVFALLTIPVWRWLWGEWMGNDYYSHGVLIPPISLFLIIQRIRHDKEFQWHPGQGLAGGLAVLTLSTLVYLWFLNQRAYYLAAFAMIGMIAGLIWLFGGTSAIRKLAFPVAYLVFMVPLPFIDRYTLPLALFTGVCSGGIAQLLGLDVLIVGNAVSLPNADLLIGAQCSGVNSLIALSALMTLVAYLVDGPMWGRIVLALSSIPLAILGNILRVTSLFFVARAWGADAAFTFYHDYSGIVFFVFVLLLLYPLARLVRCGQLRSDVI